jgi:tetratricopeptide (TPR) repeat protein
MNTQEKFELIIEGKLSEHEIREFNKQLEENPALSEEFEKYRKTHQIAQKELYSPILSDEDDPFINSLSLEQKLEIDNDVSEFYKNPKTSHDESLKIFREKIKKIGRHNQGNGVWEIIRAYYKIAALLVSGILLSYILIRVYISSDKAESPLAMYEKYYAPLKDENLKSFRTYDFDLQKEFLAFRNADPVSDSMKIYDIAEEYDTEYKYTILNGLISLEKGNYQTARNYFQTALDKSTSGSRYIAEWYLSLTCLRDNHKDQAVELLTHLGSVDNPYRNKARKLVEKLNKTVK